MNPGMTWLTRWLLSTGSMANTVKVLVHQGMLFLQYDIRGLRHAGRSENIEWGRSYLKLGKIRLSEQIFVCNSTLGPGIGYTPHQLVLGIGSGIPGNYQAPESESSKFAQSLKRIKSGINQTQAQQAPSTLGGDFPYKPGDLVNFLGPRGRIGQGYITGIFGKEYRVAHSGT